MTSQPPNSSTPHTTNAAAPGATVGIQADQVHHATVYQIHPQSSPQEKYQVGCNYLENGVPLMAEHLISEAIAGGHSSAEVRFHWLLAMLSKRSYRDLSRGERDRLAEFARDRWLYPESDYRAGLEAGQELASHLSGLGGDVDAAEKKILALPPDLRAKTERHLAFILSGATRDKLWEATKEQAEANRMSDNRANRMWAYFHPKPVRPRLAESEPPCITTSDQYRLTFSLLLFGISVAYIGWLTVSSAALMPIAVLILAVPAAVIGLRHASEWHYVLYKVELEEHRHFGNPVLGHLRGAGFAREISQDFEGYFSKYRPGQVEPGVWLDETAGIRGMLRAEIARMYRESRVDAVRVRWLIGFLAKDVRRRWQSGTLYDYRERYRLTWPLVIRSVAGLAATLVCTLTVFDTAIGSGQLLAWPAMLCMSISGPYAALRAQHIECENRRYAGDQVESQRELEKRMAAYHEWLDKLEKTRPSEYNMETWLHCDKTMLLDAALRHYRLSWRDVIAYAVLQGPGDKTKRARVHGGPWRYSVYQLRYFLITTEGVREVSTVLRFQEGTFEGQERSNYRFEAVSSVEVTEKNHQRELKLTLTNGPTREIHITDADTGEADPYIGTPDEMVKLNLNAAGFTHALPILEGIAAEGKGWLDGGNNAFADTR